MLVTLAPAATNVQPVLRWPAFMLVVLVVGEFVAFVGWAIEPKCLRRPLLDDTTTTTDCGVCAVRNTPTLENKFFSAT